MKLKATGEIIIERTTGGVPHVLVSCESDMYYGLGYCHAMDRGMQMLMMKILGRGTASEHLSGDDEMLEIDKFFRRMNWYNNLDDEIQKLDNKDLHLLQAYCDGANAAFKKK